MLFGNSPSDFGFLPPQLKSDCQIFLPNGITPSATANWQQWIKPKGITMVHMIAVGGGGGGGGGRSGASNTQRGGGGGGGGAGISSLMIPAIFLPDALKVSVGQGGQGGAANTAGVVGSISYISTGTGLTSGTSLLNLILSANGGALGNPGLITGAGAGGGAAAAITISQLSPIAKFGIFTNAGTLGNAGYVGIAGTNGGANTGGPGTGTSNVWSGSPIHGGTGGAGIQTPAQVGSTGGALNLQDETDFADGTFTPATNFRLGGAAGTSGVAGGNGNAGVKSLKPFLNTGGTGGGSCDNAAGGQGGAGGYGSGGGGGGAGTTGGRGGNGGDGVVIITSW